MQGMSDRVLVGWLLTGCVSRSVVSHEGSFPGETLTLRVFGNSGRGVVSLADEFAEVLATSGV